jgi:PPM family protein phosphatase
MRFGSHGRLEDTHVVDTMASTPHSPGQQVVVEVYGVTDVGSVRRNNEDAFVAADLAGPRYEDSDVAVRFAPGPRGCFVAVADGMGGAAAGEVASALALRSAEQSLRNDALSAPLDALDRALAYAHSEVRRAAETKERQGMGTTLVTALFHESSAYVAAVGDSRAYLARRGEIVQVTTDHSFSELLARSGEEGRRAAQQADFKNVVLQAIGQQGTVECSLSAIDLAYNDVLLLCSDGLSGYVTAAEMLDVITKSWTLQAAGRRLIFLCNRRGGADNITVTLARVVDGLPYKEARAASAIRHHREPDLWRMANQVRS